jgi:DNA-binding response OmpR family regulator
MARRTALIVEDDGAIRKGLADALRFSGYEVLEAADGNRGLDMALECKYDILLLDLLLPGRDGFALLEALRDSRPGVPVIVLTAKGDESDRVRGLTLGADDYVVKPFSIKELAARMDAVLRRSAERPTDLATVEIPGGVADMLRREVRFQDGAREELSQREAELLRYLVVNAGRAVSREEILARVWRLNPRGVAQTRAIDMHVTRLRSKLRDDPDDPRLLFTVRGTGYMFAARS